MVKAESRAGEMALDAIMTNYDCPVRFYRASPRFFIARLPPPRSLREIKP